MAAKALMKILLLLTRVFKAGALLMLTTGATRFGPLSTRFAAVAPLAAASLAIWVTSLS